MNECASTSYLCVWERVGVGWGRWKSDEESSTSRELDKSSNAALYRLRDLSAKIFPRRSHIYFLVTFQALSPKSAIWAQKLRFKIYDLLDRFDQKIAAILRCAVKESDWRLAWDTLQEPFIVMYPQQQ